MTFHILSRLPISKMSSTASGSHFEGDHEMRACLFNLIFFTSTKTIAPTTTARIALKVDPKSSLRAMIFVAVDTAFRRRLS